jgi:hypothetical protein
MLKLDDGFVPETSAKVCLLHVEFLGLHYF